MENKGYQDIFLRAKKYYFSIGRVRCPLLNNEWVYFSRSGFDHLIRKGRYPRPIQDQLRRFYLLPHATRALEKAESCEYRFLRRMTKGRKHKRKILIRTMVHFWTLSCIINRQKIKVVVLQENEGKKYFLSIM
jgi:hypothetical protein